MSDLIEEAAKAFYQASISKPAFRIRPPKTWDEMLPEIKAELGENLRAVFSRLDALGYAVVPKEPSAKQLLAALNAEFKHYHPEGGATMRGSSVALMAKLYRAMLDKAMEGPK